MAINITLQSEIVSLCSVTYVWNKTCKTWSDLYFVPCSPFM